MDVNLHTMMLQNVPSIELNRRLLQNEINSRRVAQILVDASQPDVELIPTSRNHSRTTSDDDQPCCNVTAAVNRPPADEYTSDVTTARYIADVTQPADGSVKLNLARKRHARTTRRSRFHPSSANKDDFTALNGRTAAAAPTVSWNSSFPFVNRTSAEDEWDKSNTTSALTDNSSSSQSVYCPAIPPGLRELSIFYFCWRFSRLSK